MISQENDKITRKETATQKNKYIFAGSWACAAFLIFPLHTEYFLLPLLLPSFSFILYFLICIINYFGVRIYVFVYHISILWVYASYLSIRWEQDLYLTLYSCTPQNLKGILCLINTVDNLRFLLSGFSEA